MIWKQGINNMDASFLLIVEVFLLTVRPFYLQQWGSRKQKNTKPNFQTGGTVLGTSASLTEVSRALRAQNAEKVSIVSPGTPKSLQEVPEHFKSPDTFWRVSGDLPDCPQDFLGTFWGLGARGPGRHFRDFFGISGPEGPGDPCKGRAGSQEQ